MYLLKKNPSISGPLQFKDCVVQGSTVVSLWQDWIIIWSKPELFFTEPTVTSAGVQPRLIQGIRRRDSVGDLFKC